MKLVTLCALVLVLATAWAKPVRRDKMINPNLFQGDMKISRRNGDRNAVPLDSQRWPGGVVPYVIDEDLTNERTLNILKQVMYYLKKNTCLEFVKRTTEEDYIKIFSGDGCYSEWGRIGGEQELSLEVGGCEYFGTIVHELLHAVGFDHEQGRSDRDDYLIIRWENIEEDQFDQFEKRKPHEERIFNKFDFDSIMLYGPSVFAKYPDVHAVDAKDGREIKEVIDKVYPSKSDIDRVKILYQCKK